jgi:transcriptional regulator with XRE-family HTH domain
MLGLEFRRRCLRLSQTTIARLSDVEQTRVSDFEHGLRPTQDELTRLADALEFPRESAHLLIKDVGLPENWPEIPAPPDIVEEIRRTRR